MRTTAPPHRHTVVYVLVTPSTHPVARTPGVDPEGLRRSLWQFGTPPIELRETHGSWVFLTADRAFKLKKPLRFDFADLRDPESRRRACAEEANANRVLAPGLEYELRSVVPVGHGYSIAAADHPDAVDHVVVSRRFDESTTMAAHLGRGALVPEQAAAVGRRIAAFHRHARVVRAAPDARAVADRNFQGLIPLARGVVPSRDILAARRFSEAFLLCWEDVLRGRAEAGRVVDGHGDLRAEHVLLDPEAPEGITIIDRLDHPRLRIVDVVDDLAFLCMDLEGSAAPAAAAAVLEGYVEGGGEPPPRELLAYFGAYRATVRAKVALIRARQEQDPTGQEAEAVRLLGLARRLAARARGEFVLLITGPPASGKSTLSDALGAATGLPVLRSDEVRHDVSDDYGLAGRTRVYAELGRRAGLERACIVDATFGEPAIRQAFFAELDSDHRRNVLAVECQARPQTLQHRARVRVPGRWYGSEADAEVSAQLARSFSPLDELAPRDRLALNSEDEPERLMGAIESWLDGHLAAGRLS